MADYQPVQTEGAPADSPARQLHTGVKLLVTLLYIAFIASLPVASPAGYAPFWVYPVFMTAFTGVRVKYLAKRLPAALPFALMAGAGRLLLFREPVLVAGITVTDGMLSGAALFMKAVLCVWAALLLAAATTPAEISRQMAAFGLPAVFCASFELVCRYMSSLTDEAKTLLTAYRLRGGSGNGVNARHMGVLLGQWFLRAYDRAERIHHAMLCRGYDETYRDKTSRHTAAKRSNRMRVADGVFLGLTAALLLGCRIWFV